jgi:hypothetical protein
VHLLFEAVVLLLHQSQLPLLLPQLLLLPLLPLPGPAELVLEDVAFLPALAPDLGLQAVLLLLALELVLVDLVPERLASFLDLFGPGLRLGLGLYRLLDHLYPQLHLVYLRRVAPLLKHWLHRLHVVYLVVELLAPQGLNHDRPATLQQLYVLLLPLYLAPQQLDLRLQFALCPLQLLDRFL